MVRGLHVCPPRRTRSTGKCSRIVQAARGGAERDGSTPPARASSAPWSVSNAPRRPVAMPNPVPPTARPPTASSHALKSVVMGQHVSVRVYLGGRSLINKKISYQNYKAKQH